MWRLTDSELAGELMAIVIAMTVIAGILAQCGGA